MREVFNLRASLTNGLGSKSFQRHMPREELEGFYYHDKARQRDNSNSWPEENPGHNRALRNAEGAVQTTVQELETSLLIRLISAGQVGMKPWGSREPHLLLRNAMRLWLC